MPSLRLLALLCPSGGLPVAAAPGSRADGPARHHPPPRNPNQSLTPKMAVRIREIFLARAGQLRGYHRLSSAKASCTLRGTTKSLDRGDGARKNLVGRVRRGRGDQEKSSVFVTETPPNIVAAT